MIRRKKRIASGFFYGGTVPEEVDQKRVMVKARVTLIFRCDGCGKRLGDMHPRSGGMRIFFENHSEPKEIKFKEDTRTLEIECGKCGILNGIIV